MTIKDIKAEARKKLALNIHQAIVIYTVEFAIFITLIALIVMSCVSLGVVTPAAIVMICYGVVLCLIAIIGIGMVGFAMCDFYLATYKCKPYNIRRLGDTLARSGATKLLLLSLKRTVLAFLLLLCLIVPGIIYLIRTSMANYLLIANPKMNASKALSASNKVMSGKTGSYFALCMSMIGWYILGILTLGLGFVFILPYVNLIKAVYYKRNLQGDKAVYNIVVQPVSVVQMQQQASNIGAQAAAQDAQQIPPQDGVVLAPIDTLADDDIIDMTEAMRDFEGGSPAVDVREVPISPVTAAKNTSENIVLQAEPMAQAEQPPIIADSSEPEAHAIDGTSLVATERILSTQEINASDEVFKKKIEAMYSNSGSKKSDVDYLSMDKPKSDDFLDDFGVTPEQDEETPQPIGDEVQNIISDSEFDEFLKNFDSMTEQTPAAPQNNDEQQIIAPAADIEPEAPQNKVAADNNIARAERFSAHAARDRVSPHERASSANRSARRPVNNDNNGTPEVVDRAERIRREREERLHLNNKK